MHGYGKLYYESGAVAYEGYWNNDEFHGYGKVYNDQPDFQGKDYDYSDLSHIAQRWLTFEGDFKHDSKEGQGAMILTNG